MNNENLKTKFSPPIFRIDKGINASERKSLRIIVENVCKNPLSNKNRQLSAKSTQQTIEHDPKIDSSFKVNSNLSDAERRYMKYFKTKKLLKCEARTRKNFLKRWFSLRAKTIKFPTNQYLK